MIVVEFKLWSDVSKSYFDLLFKKVFKNSNSIDEDVVTDYIIKMLKELDDEFYFLMNSSNKPPTIFISVKKKNTSYKNDSESIFLDTCLNLLFTYSRQNIRLSML